MKRMMLLAAMLVFAGPALAQAPAAGRAAAPPAMHAVVMTLSSSDIVDGGVIPDKHTAKAAPAKPVSPALSWTGTPAATQSFVLVMHDLDVVVGKGTVDNLHWLAFNIPGTATSLPQGVPSTATLPDGTVQPKNGFQGPGAPPGIYHHYVFELWALDAKLPLDANASRDDVMKAMDGHVLDKAALVGRFHR